MVMKIISIITRNPRSYNEIVPPQYLGATIYVLDGEQLVSPLISEKLRGTKVSLTDLLHNIEAVHGAGKRRGTYSSSPSPSPNSSSSAPPPPPPPSSGSSSSSSSSSSSP